MNKNLSMSSSSKDSRKDVYLRRRKSEQYLPQRKDERIISLLRLKALSRQEPDHVILASKSKCKQRSDALTELEEIYKRLQLNDDEDLLDRAERRDLPSRFQLMKFQRQESINNNHHNHTLIQYTSSSDVDETDESSSCNSVYSQYSERRRPISSLETRIVSETHSHIPRLRTPSLRRSAIPDLIADDYAVRKLTQINKRTNFNSIKHLSKSMSYLLLSSAYTPTVNEPWQCRSELNLDSYDRDCPNIEKDDAFYRKLTQADAANVPPPPPPFGIPLYENSLVDTGSQSYLHVNLNTKDREYCFLKPYSPHLIRDDMAFRNYRKDDNDSTQERSDSPPTYPVTLYHTYNNITRLSTLL